MAENPQVTPPDAPPAVPEATKPNLACLREVAVEIPADVVSKEFDSATQRYSQYPVPGFRRGKVPASVIRKRFADEIRKDVLQSLLPRYYQQAVVKAGFLPISEPQFHSLAMEPDKPVQFKAAFEILPDIQLGNYQEMKLEVPEVSVTDEDVEGTLKHLQEEQASYDPVEEDRPIQDKDFVQISFQATEKQAAPAEGEAPQAAEANQPVQLDEVMVEIGGENTLSQFSDNLRGAKPGEERTFDVVYSADHYDRRLAGKTLSYAAKVNAIKKKTMPELTDEFAKELSPDVQTLEDLKGQLRKRILAERQAQVAYQTRTTLLGQLAESHDFPVPETLIQNQIDLRLERWLRSLAAQGITKEAMKRLDFKSIRRTHREAATKDVKADLLLEKIAEAENLQVTDEEVTQEIHTLAEQAKETPEALEKRLTESGGFERIRYRIRSEKAFRFLYDKSTGNAGNGAAQE